MPEFPPDKLAAWTGGRWTFPPPSAPTGFAIDSRRMRAGEMFVALRTGKRDGHEFLGAARQAGAAAAMVSEPRPEAGLPQLVVADPLAAFQAVARRHRREFAGVVIGVSGSAGKTSTKDLLAILLGGSRRAEPGPAGPVLATEGNLNNHLGVPLTLTRLDPAVHRFAVIEAGVGAPGEMAPLAAMIEPDLALITLVAPAHLENFGDLAAIAAEKAALPAAVRAGGTAVFPASCSRFEAFRRLPAAKLIVGQPPGRPGDPAEAGGRAERVGLSLSQGPDATTVTLSGGPAPGTYRLPRVSDGMAQNAALALCAALRLGVPADLLRRRLSAWEPAPLRGEWRRRGGHLLYLDCYNANPASMADALEAFRTAAPREEPRLYVLGGMEELGPEAARYHRELGRGLGLRPADFAFVLGPLAGEVQAGALEGGARPDQVAPADSLDPVAARMASFAGAVFIKGSRRYALERLLDPAAAPAH